jgi:hypothetical protein
MQRLPSVLFLAALAAMTSACATAGYPFQRLPSPYSAYPGRPMYGQPMGPTASYPMPALPIGRWDNVMMLAPGTPVQVLLMDGGVASGLVTGADSTSLSLEVVSGEVELASTRIMRVDRVTSSESPIRDGAKGAAFGAGVVGVIGLIAGKVPPARLFAAGGIIGAYNNVELGLSARRTATIYLAPAVAPEARPAAQLAAGAAPR